MKKINIFDISITAIFTAIIAVISQFSIMTPFGLPLSFQVFAVALTGYVLKVKLSLLSVLCYILLGVVGLPVFSGFMGGAQHIIGATGGFILGFIVLAFFCGIIKTGKKRIIFGIVGLIICHIIGIIQFSQVTGAGIFESMISMSAPYLLKDCILLILAYFLANRIDGIINKIR